MSDAERAAEMHMEFMLQMTRQMWAEIVEPNVDSLGEAAGCIKSLVAKAFMADVSTAFGSILRDSMTMGVVALCVLLEHNPQWSDAVALSIQKQAAIDSTLGALAKRVSEGGP